MSSADLIDDPPHPAVVADRKRICEGLMLIVDDLIAEIAATNHVIANTLLTNFAGEFARLRRFVRDGTSVDDFQTAREAALPSAQEVNPGGGR